MSINKEFLQRDSNITAKVICDMLGEGKDIFVYNKEGCKAVVTKYEKSYRVSLRFCDKHSHELSTSLDAINRGSFKNPYHPSVFNVGFFGVGCHKGTHKGKQSRVYKAWINMLRRCYDARTQEKDESYVGCSVDAVWHNFQNFADWYESHESYGLGYELDKDLLIEGNKIYSPKTCCLVPNDINSLFSGNFSRSSGSNCGVTVSRSGKYRARVRRYGKQTELGLYSTIDEAVEVYKKAKNDYILEVVGKYKGRISNDVFQAIIKRTL